MRAGRITAQRRRCTCAPPLSGRRNGGRRRRASDLSSRVALDKRTGCLERGGVRGERGGVRGERRKMRGGEDGVLRSVRRGCCYWVRWSGRTPLRSIAPSKTRVERPGWSEQRAVVASKEHGSGPCGSSRV